MISRHFSSLLSDCVRVCLLLGGNFLDETKLADFSVLLPLPNCKLLLMQPLIHHASVMSHIEFVSISICKSVCLI